MNCYSKTIQVSFDIWIILHWNYNAKSILCWEYIYFFIGMNRQNKKFILVDKWRGGVIQWVRSGLINYTETKEILPESFLYVFVFVFFFPQNPLARVSPLSSRSSTSQYLPLPDDEVISILIELKVSVVSHLRLPIG